MSFTIGIIVGFIAGTALSSWAWYSWYITCLRLFHQYLHSDSETNFVRFLVSFTDPWDGK